MNRAKPDARFKTSLRAVSGVSSRRPYGFRARLCDSSARGVGRILRPLWEESAQRRRMHESEKCGRSLDLVSLPAPTRESARASLFHTEQKRLDPYSALGISSALERCGPLEERAAVFRASMSASDPNGLAKYAAAPIC